MRNARWGYPTAVFDACGRGESQGIARYLDDADDAASAIAWLAAREFCDGRVAMFGGSYSGILQWSTAALRPPALAAIAPTVSPMPGLDVPACGGVPRTYEMRWAAHLHGRSTRVALFKDDAFWRELFHDHFLACDEYAALGRRLGAEIPFFETELLHVDDDTFWDRLAVDDASLAAIEVPVLTITGTADNAHRGALAFHERFLRAARPEVGAKARLIVGPWTHAGDRAPAKHDSEPPAPDPLMDADPLRYSDELTLRWFDHVLFDAPAPDIMSERASIFVQGCERWTGASSPDEIAGQRLTLHLSGEALTDAPPAEIRRRSFLFDPADRSYADREAAGAVASLSAVASSETVEDVAWSETLGDGGLAFQSDPLSEDLMIVGAPVFEINCGLDGPDADLLAGLVLLREGAPPLTLSTAVLRLSRRHHPRHGTPFPKGVIETVRLPAPGIISRLAPATATLRFVVRSLVSIGFQRPSASFADDGSPLLATVHLHGGRVELPIARKLSS
jgi:putative CocE/NonD family hydrolase